MGNKNQNQSALKSMKATKLSGCRAETQVNSQTFLLLVIIPTLGAFVFNNNINNCSGGGGLELMCLFLQRSLCTLLQQ